MRRTKIVATVGPASWDLSTLRSMIEAGLDVARIGLAHGDLDQHLTTYRLIRQAATETGKLVAILVDLPGPKIRCAPFDTGGIELIDGNPIRVTVGEEASTAEVIEVDVPEVIGEIITGDRISLGDGNIILACEGNTGNEINARVIHGGLVKGRPGFQLPSARMNLSSPTKNDLKFVDAFAEEGVDIIAISFVRSAHDIRSVGLEQPPAGPLIIAKIETQAAVQNLEGIIETAGGVMVARGDLGIDYPISELPHLQKHIIERCIARGRPVITATQMLESMIHAPTPTRAEASDVANAVFDGSSAVMLSGESAIGDDPVNSVAMMAAITERADQAFDNQSWAGRILGIKNDAQTSTPLIHKTDSLIKAATTDALTKAATTVAEQVGAVGIICLSKSGFTALKVTRFRPAVPILAYSPNERVVNQLALAWGTSSALQTDQPTTHAAIKEALKLAKTTHNFQTGDHVVVICGQSTQTRHTDTLQIERIP